MPHEWRAAFAPDLIGNDEALLRALKELKGVGDTDCSVLLWGETGTGKELAARAIHAGSARAAGPFVPVNCAALPGALLESALFGHARGAFTGAATAQEGAFVAADGGTLFLDEVGELPLAQQAKLLRVLQERVVVPVGETRGRKVDIRVVCATHRDLERMVSEGSFRLDLLYRIQVVSVELPPLRARTESIPALVAHFVARANARHRRSVTGVSDEALDWLAAWSWPGNVRELENLIERLVLLRVQGEIVAEDLPSVMRGGVASIPPGQARQLPAEGIDLRDAVERYEDNLIGQALERSGWNRNRAASMLRMNRTTLVEKLRRRRRDGQP